MVKKCWHSIAHDEGHTRPILTTDLSGSGVRSGEGVGQGRQEMSVGTRLSSSSV